MKKAWSGASWLAVMALALFTVPVVALGDTIHFVFSGTDKSLGTAGTAYQVLDQSGQYSVNLYGDSYAGSGSPASQTLHLFNNGTVNGLGVEGNGSNEIDLHDYVVIDFSSVMARVQSVVLNFAEIQTDEYVRIADLTSTAPTGTQLGTLSQPAAYGTAAGTKSVQLLNFGTSAGTFHIFGVGADCRFVLSGIDVTLTSTPEPATWALAGLALLALATMAKRKRVQA